MCMTFRSCFAVVGKPEAAARIKDEIVGRDQRRAVASVVQAFHLAGRKVDALDSAARVRRRSVTGNEQPRAPVEFKTAAIVADVKRAVGTDGKSVRSASRSRNRLLLAAGLDTRDFAGRDLDDKYRTVLHRHRPFRKLQTRRNFANVHTRPPHHLPCQAREYCTMEARKRAK